MWPHNGLLSNIMGMMLLTSKHWKFFLLQIHSNKSAKFKKKPTQKTAYKDTLNSILTT